MPHRDFLEARAPREAGHNASDALRSPFVRANRQSRHFDDEPLLSPDRRHGQKKTLVAREQNHPDISRHRKRWRTYQGLIDPRRLVFIDETWTKTNMTRLRGWAPKGERLVDKVPHGRWKTTTPRRPAQRPHRRALPVRSAHQRRALPRLCRTVPRPDAEAGRRRDPRQSGLPQGKGGATCDPQRRGAPRVPAKYSPTSIPLSRSSPSSKPCCERREREATKPYPKPALRSSLNTHQKNTSSTSGRMRASSLRRYC